MFNKIIFTVILALGCIHTPILANTDSLRKIFHESVLDRGMMPQFLIEIGKIVNPTPIEKAYIGAYEALKARDSWNPIDKLISIHKSRKLLLDAINNDEENLEIRFLRFSIEYNIPSILRSKESITEDKYMIINNLSKSNTSFDLDKNLVKYILRFFEDTKSCSKSEIDLIKSKFTN